MLIPATTERKVKASKSGRGLEREKAEQAVIHCSKAEEKKKGMH